MRQQVLNPAFCDPPYCQFQASRSSDKKEGCGGGGGEAVWGEVFSNTLRAVSFTKK